MPSKQVLTAYRSLETVCYLAGALMLAFFISQLAMGEVERQGGIAAFEEAASANADEQAATLDLAGTENPDTTLWNAQRVADYQASLTQELPPVLGVLDIPSVSLKVPVYQTNTDLVMDRGAGVIDGMAYPHEPGNIGISGHRDGYFRVLKDIAVGDTIVLQTLEGNKRFRIDATHIVEIEDERLLRDTDDQTLTLVTCYPFYFVGHAPQRFIVTASLDTTYVNQN
ncbi:MAG: class D sortase [Halioglobus sp.]